VAMNIAKVNLKVWAINTSPVHQIEATAHGIQEWTLQKAVEGKFYSQYSMPVVVHNATDPPKNGDWKKIGLDKEVYSFFDRWHEVLVQLPASASGSAFSYTESERKILLEAFSNAAYHWPVHIFYMEFTPDVEVNIFVKTLSLIQQFRKGEEIHGDSGWETCCHIARARDLGQKASQQSGDEMSQTEDILVKVDWASSSDVKFEKHKDEKRKKKGDNESNSKKLKKSFAFTTASRNSNALQSWLQAASNSLRVSSTRRRSLSVSLGSLATPSALSAISTQWRSASSWHSCA
jgi:hypothetical protein